MSEKVRLKYNPSLSIKENAQRCGVSESSVRNYLKTHGYDRRNDTTLIRLRKVKTLMQKGLSAKEIASSMGICLNTAKKYMKIESIDIIPNGNKRSMLVKNNESIIKSVSYSQYEILSNILKLYVRQGFFEVDFTYSIGEFYANGVVPMPARKYDKYPQSEGVLPLENAEDMEDASIRSAVIDLPFLITKRECAYNSKMNIRFNSFDNPQEAFNANVYMLELAQRKLLKNGVLVMKTMDVLRGNHQIWMSHFLICEAEKMGFRLIDMFILIAKNRLLKAGKQKVARKFHSYFLVFRKM